MNDTLLRYAAQLCFLCLAPVALSACGGDDDGQSTGDGTLTVTLDAEESITEGIEPGDGEENLVDGWAVNFDTYLMAIDKVEIGKGGKTQTSDQAYIVDLASLPTTGFTLASFNGIATGQWETFSFGITTGDKAEPTDGLSNDDVTRMQSEKLTYLIRGTASKGDASIDFEFAERVPVKFGPCQTEDGPPGFSVTDQGTTTVAATIHGDHVFFNGFPSGAEIVGRRAAWLQTVDQLGNNDGNVDDEELAGIEGAELEMVFPSAAPSNPDDAQYSFAGSPLPIENARDWVVGQLATQGHFQGEGECPWTLE